MSSAHLFEDKQVKLSTFIKLQKKKKLSGDPSIFFHSEVLRSLFMPIQIWKSTGINQWDPDNPEHILWETIKRKPTSYHQYLSRIMYSSHFGPSSRAFMLTLCKVVAPRLRIVTLGDKLVTRGSFCVNCPARLTLDWKFRLETKNGTYFGMLDLLLWKRWSG